MADDQIAVKITKPLASFCLIVKDAELIQSIPNSKN